MKIVMAAVGFALAAAALIGVSATVAQDPAEHTTAYAAQQEIMYW